MEQEGRLTPPAVLFQDVKAVCSACRAISFLLPMALEPTEGRQAMASKQLKNSGLLRYNLNAATLTRLRCAVLSFDRCIQSCNHHPSQDKQCFLHPQKFPLVVNPFLSPPDSGYHLSDFCPYSFAFSKMSHKWNPYI